jgi:hypothetical protein
MSLEIKVNLLIKRRLSQLRKGTISSEDFEKATVPEQNLARVNEQIAKMERRSRRPQTGFYQLVAPARS